MKTNRAVAAVLVAALLIGAAPAVVALATHAVPMQDEVPVTTSATPTIVLASSTGTEVDMVDMWQGEELHIQTADGTIVVSGDPGARARLATTDITGTTTQVTDIEAGSDWLELNPEDKNRVDVRGDVTSLAFADITPDDGETDIQLSAPVDGTGELRLYDLEASTDYALYDASRDEVLGSFTTDTNGAGSTQVALPDGSHAFEVRSADDFAAPALSNAEPEGELESVPDQLSVDVEAEAWPVEVEFTLDGQVVETTTIEESSTVTADITVDEARQYDWSVTATDELGQETTLATSFDTSTVADPVVSNPQPEGQLTERPDELSVDVEGAAWPVEVEFTLDGQVVDTVVLEQNGTASVNPALDELGTFEWSATATDAIGQSDSVTATFQTPDTLTLREEHAPQQLVDNATLRVRFFTVGGDIAIERETDDGTLDMEGLPDSRFVLFVESPDHYDRRVYIESIFEQESVYLLNESEFPRGTNDAVRTRFVYEDMTGQFPTSDTTVQIERAIDLDGDGESEYKVIAGDFWGASSEFEAVFERGERYRIVLVNQETNQRHVAGSHLPTEDLTQTIRVAGLVEEAANATGVIGLADLADDGESIDILYRDPANETDQLTVTVRPRGGGDPIFEDTIDGPLGTHGQSLELNETQAEQDWVVEFDAGDRHRSAIPVGSGAVGLPMDVPGWLLTLLGTMAVTFVGALYGPRTALLGAWAMVFVAAGLAMFGWAFSMVSVIVAALVAVGVTLMSRALP